MAERNKFGSEHEYGSDSSLENLKKKCEKIVKCANSKSKKENLNCDLVPPDGGWGWLVLAGSMMVNVLIPGTIKSFGVLFLEFLEAFDASPSTAAWIPAICYFLYSSLGPVSSILSVKYSYRTVTLIGGAFAATGMIASFWAFSLTYLYISYGLMVGIGAGLSFPPTVYIVTSYFVRRRGLANGLCISGSALGSIILPPVLRWLLENYGYRGSVLIMGGITLNVFAAALFYEPVEQHMVPSGKIKKTSLDGEEEDVGIVLKFKNLSNTTTNAKHSIEPAPKAEWGALMAEETNEIATEDRSKKHDAILNKAHAKIQSRTSTFAQINTQSSFVSTIEDDRFKARLALRNSFSRRITRRSTSTSSFQYISTPYHGSTLSFQPKEVSHISLRSIASGVFRDETQQQREDAQNKRQKFMDFSLLKDPIYLIILVSNSTNAIGYTNFIILLPSYGVTLGFDKSLAAYLISIVSTTDLIGRIGGSTLSDLGYIPKTWYFVGGLAISGISLTLLPFYTTYHMVSLFCGIFGLASGIYVGITAVIMADMLGTERLTSSYGISLFMNGILQLIGPPLCGLWFESSHSYKPLFCTLGVILISGASLWCFMPNNKKKNEFNDYNSTPVENGLLEE